jgi:hypothetical protein
MTTAEVIALLISLLSASLSGFAVYLSNETKKNTENHNKLSLRPYLNLMYNLSVEHRPSRQSLETLKITLSNKGVGPAVIQSAELFVDGQKTQHTITCADCTTTRCISAGC